MTLTCDLSITVASNTMIPALTPKQGMVKMSIGGNACIGYTFQISNLNRSLMLEMAEEIQLKGNVTSIVAFSGYSGGTAVGKVIKVRQDESIYSAIVKSVRSIQQHVLELESHAGWNGCTLR